MQLIFFYFQSFLLLAFGLPILISSWHKLGVVRMARITSMVIMIRKVRMAKMVEIALTTLKLKF